MKDKTKSSPYALFALCWLAYSTSYITKLCYSISMYEMAGRGLFTLAFGGAIGTGFLACYGCGQLVNGRLGDKINPKYMVGIGLVLSSFMNFAMGITQAKYLLLVVWCINGFGCSMLWAPVLRCISEYLPEDIKIKAGTYISATIPAGTLAAYGLGGLLLKTSSYKMLFFAAGGIGIIMSWVWFIGMNRLKDYLVYAKENYIPACKKNTRESADSRFIPLLLSTGAIFAVGCILFNGVLKDGVTLWLPVYFNDFFGVSGSAASTILLILPVINLAGAITAVKLNTKIFRNELTTACAMFGISLAGIILLFVFGKYSVITAAVFVSLFTSAMLGANTMLLTFMPMRFASVGRASTLTGFLDACSYLASALSAVTIGLVAENYGWNVTVISWAAVAAAGLAVSAVGIPYWSRGRTTLD
ncbi:MAG: MFS transporter [Eubacteriales bacterium]|nr:MFS transporter [Eubacteriales bacterium]